MKVCFYARAGQLELYSAMAKKLAFENIDSFFITQNIGETIYIRHNNPESNVYEIERYLEDNWNSAKLKKTEEILSDYSKINLWRIYYTDRFLVKYNTEDSIKMIRLHFDFFEKVFSKEKPDYFFNEVIAIFAAYTAMVVGERYGCRYIGTIIARDDAHNRFFFVEDLYQRNRKMEKSYKEDIFNEDEINEAKEYLEHFRENCTTPSYNDRFKRKPKLTVKMLLYIIKYLVEKNKKIFTNKAAYMTYNRAFETIASPLLFHYRYLRSRKYYQQPRAGERYYLYTLHFQPEASTLVCAAKYEKQLFAIDSIAKSIPGDSILYVKEHYVILGHRDLNFYKELQRYPNIRLINPFADIHSLIKNCLAVIVLTSTTGFEAILHGKKVFVLGEVFYDFFENATIIRDIYDEHIKLDDTETIAGDDEIIKFICAYKNSLYKGCVYYGFDEYNKESNIDDIIRGFKDYIGYRR